MLLTATDPGPGWEAPLRGENWATNRQIKTSPITFLSHATRFTKEACFLEGSLVSSVCPSGKNSV
jgi:hypothetical protein